MARDFDGNGDKINFGNVTPKTSGISIAGWVNLNNVEDVSNDHRIFASVSISTSDSTVNSTVNIGDWTAANDTRIQFGYKDGGWTEHFSDSEISITGWQNVVVTYDGSNVRFYLNGVADGAPAETGSLPTSGTYDFQVGTRSNSGTSVDFDGFIAEVAYWERVLTAGEAAGLGKGFSPEFYPKDLRVYTHIFGRESPEPSLVGASGTIGGTPSYVDHPRIIIPSSKQIRWFSAVAAAELVQDVLQPGIIPFAR
ncbi:MAG TPA: LamG domain-containing protein [bacterium]|nr:LamG domain-containing protein [bacterium]